MPGPAGDHAGVDELEAGRQGVVDHHRGRGAEQHPGFAGDGGEGVDPVARRAPQPVAPAVDVAGGERHPGDLAAERARHPHRGGGRLAREVEGGDEGEPPGVGLGDDVGCADRPLGRVEERARLGGVARVDIDAQTRQDRRHDLRL